MPTTLALPRQLLRLTAGLAATAAFVLALLIAGSSAWQVWFFLAAPDLALLLGAWAGLERGRPHPRAVPLYNAVHRLAGPAVLAVASIWIGEVWLAAALAWSAHIALDRAVGYRLRTPDGFQRAA